MEPIFIGLNFESPKVDLLSGSAQGFWELSSLTATHNNHRAPIRISSKLALYQPQTLFKGALDPFYRTPTIVPYHAIPYHTIPYHTIPYHTIPYHTIPYHTIPYHTIPYHTIPYHTIPYHTIPYHTIPYHTRLYPTILYHTRLYQTILYLKGFENDF